MWPGPGQMPIGQGGRERKCYRCPTIFQSVQPNNVFQIFGNKSSIGGMEITWIVDAEQLEAYSQLTAHTNWIGSFLAHFFNGLHPHSIRHYYLKSILWRKHSAFCTAVCRTSAIKVPNSAEKFRIFPMPNTLHWIHPAAFEQRFRATS